MRERLDVLVTQRGFARSRSQAHDLIRRGCISVDGETATKPALLLPGDAEIAVAGAEAGRVSRAGGKLEAALDHFGLSPAGLAALDIGASTGGFSQVLLERGARRVYAVDVGHGQLASRVAADPRVVSLEGTDARRLTGELVPEPIGCLVADVSFISLRLALPVPLGLTAPGAWLVALVKPQFELTPEAIDGRGVVRSSDLVLKAMVELRDWLAGRKDWAVLGDMPSPLPGRGGNQEHLIAARRTV